MYTNSIDCGVVFHLVRTVASEDHPLEILLESAAEGRMAKLILRDNLTGSIDVSCYHCVCLCLSLYVCLCLCLLSVSVCLYL